MNHSFRHRSHAGQLLALELKKYCNRADVIVVGLPRGGVPVAFEVAKALNVPLDVFLVRKLGVPGYPELAMGAIASGGVRVLNDAVVYELDVSRRVIDAAARDQEAELRRRELLYRGHSRTPDFHNKTVIIVDDGIATGSTMKAALRALRHQGAARVVIAAPTAARASVQELKTEADEIVTLITPDPFVAVGDWYTDFGQINEDEVTALLDEARAGFAGIAPPHPTTP